MPNFTDRAVRITVPFGALEDAPRMNHEAHDALRERNRARYGIAQALPPAAAPLSAPTLGSVGAPADGSGRGTISMFTNASAGVGQRDRSPPKPRRKDPDGIDMRASET